MTRGKITHLIDSLGSGGAERLLVAYAPRLAKLGFDVDVVVLHERGGNWMREPLEAAGVPVRTVEVDKLRRVDQIIGFHQAMKKSAPDLMHAHLEFASMLSSISGHLQNKPVVATLHTLDAPEAVDRQSARRWLMYKTLARYADRVICLTKANADIARQTGLGSASIEILPNGVEVEQYAQPPLTDRKTLREQHNIPLDAPLAVSVCVLRPEKGLDRLLRAFPKVRERLPDAHLLMVGDGPEMGRLTEMVENEGLAGFVHLAGYRKDVADVMHAADLFVLPTLFDAQPTVIMEAMAACLPVVSTTFAGIPDMIEHGKHGLLVTPDDVPALADALATVLADPAMGKAFGMAGRVRATEEFSMNRQIERLAGMYDQLIAENRRSA